MKFLILFLSLFSLNSYAQVKIVVIDNFSSYHGKAVVEIIKENAPSAHITTFDFDGNNLDSYYNMLNQVLVGEFDILNLSMGHADYDAEEANLIRQISNKGIKIVTAAGNHNERLGKNNQIFPCMLKLENLYCVGAGIDKKAKASNFGVNVSYFIDGRYKNEDATSFSAPRFVSLMSKIIHLQGISIDSLLESRSQYVLNQDEAIRIIDFESLSKDLNYLNLLLTSSYKTAL